PHGTVGTISLRGRYLAPGYWRASELTARHFRNNPDGTRSYTGGDLGFINEEGELVFVGRKDANCKVRGQLVDIAEAEREVSALPGVADCAVVAVPRGSDEFQLVAYVVPNPEHALSSQKVRDAARAVMAQHVVPSLFVLVEALPRSANGKVNRAELRDHV